MSKNEISGLSRRHFLAAMAAAGLVQATSPLVAAKTFGYQETALFMGTLVRIDVAGVSEARAEDAVEHAFAKGRELEAVLTRFDSSSPLGVLNSQGSLEDVPPQLSLMLERSRLVHRLTEGSFEPSILPLLQAMQDASARGEQLHSDNAGELLSRVDYTRVQTGNGVRLGEGMSLTLDGIAKGYIAGAGEIVEQLITDTLEKNFMPYAMSVIMSRAIPEIDGFKPSHRKLLYTMYKMGLLNSGRVKSANIVGQTMKLNPHGDAAIYDTMVRLSRGYEALLHPYVDSKGNFGKY